ncbi:MAG: MBOAT family protein [Planctomycetes bacterium]|jgi:D-alanyl-lipoteichoic acid acyltransferase DltB (MBOAT superfamily)|nr:MBOAT family protein [Planctomycetota bacterium]
MLFQTLPFLVFFAILYPVYLLTKETRLRLPLLLVASYVFYAWLSPLYLIPLAYATLVDYFITGRIERGRHKKAWLALSIVNDLGILAFFKYAGFAAENLNVLFSGLRIPYTIPQPGLLLPAGLSFYLLQSIGYTIDIYRGTVQREKSLLAYAVFVSFFPRLLAGPIERAGNLLPQLRTGARVSLRDFTDGLSIFVVGYFKKVALADYLVLYVNKVYGAPEEFQAPALLLATFLFAWQIYFDFSGYTDMARGIARMMGIRLMLNFNNPYLATSMGDFWRRWHISLSSWFRDYVYIPLGGNRAGKLATYRNLFLTMVLSGLWHGAAWTFVLWGVVHALGNFATRELERTETYRQRVPTLAKQLFVFAFVMLAWIFFRARSIGDAGTILVRIFTSGFADPRCPVLMLLLIGAVWAYQYLFESRLRRILEWRIVRVTLMILLLAYLVLTVPAEGQPFIYMQF